ncbi:hypothetical protein THOM_2758, partial [Trachipleistophora hominis]
VALMSGAKTNKSRKFNIPKIESDASHDIKPSSLQNKCNVVENVLDESQNFIKRPKKMLELLFVTWQDRESSNLKNKNGRKDYYTDNNVSFRFSELKERFIDFRGRYTSYL